MSIESPCTDRSPDVCVSDDEWEGGRCRRNQTGWGLQRPWEGNTFLTFILQCQCSSSP